jgi:hypothetical protein
MVMGGDGVSDSFRAYASEECGPDGYPIAWHAEIKHLVREQAGHRCVRCGHPYRNGQHGNGEWSPCDFRCTHGGPTRMDNDAPTFQVAQWRVLTVHHLDGDKRNCRWWNLAALCQRCHLQIQGRVKMGQVYPHEHSEWFRPFAASFYAWSYLGEDLSREETEARLDELLALELVR